MPIYVRQATSNDKAAQTASQDTKVLPEFPPFLVLLVCLVVKAVG